MYSKEMKFKTNENGTINQTERNKLKTDLQEQLLPVILKELNCDYVKTKEGIILLLPNDEEGLIPLQFEIKVKNLNYDYETLAKEYEDSLILKQKEKEKKAEKIKKEKEKKTKKENS